MVRIGSHEENEVIGQGEFNCPKCKTNTNDCQVYQVSLSFTLGFFIPMGTTKRLELICPSCQSIFPLRVTKEDFAVSKTKVLNQIMGKAEGPLDIILFVGLAFATCIPVMGILLALLGGYLNRYSKTWLKKGYLVLFVLSILNTLISIVLAIMFSK